MALYVVQARGDDQAALDRATMTKDGFSRWAFVFGPFWLLFRQLWLPLLAWVVIEGAYIILVAPHVAAAASFAVDLLAHVWLGFEGHALLIAKQARRAILTDVVAGRTRDEAELRFFRRLRPDPVARAEF